MAERDLVATLRADDTHFLFVQGGRPILRAKPRHSCDWPDVAALRSEVLAKAEEIAARPQPKRGRKSGLVAAE